jgi:hypothetical protein
MTPCRTLIKVFAGSIATFAVAYTMNMVLQVADQRAAPEIGELECN